MGTRVTPAQLFPTEGKLKIKTQKKHTGKEDTEGRARVEAEVFLTNQKQPVHPVYVSCFIRFHFKQLKYRKISFIHLLYPQHSEH